MARKTKAETPKSLAAAQTDITQALQTALTVAESTSLAENQRANRATRELVRGAASAENMLEAARKATSRSRVGGVDLAGMLAGQLSNEGINWLLRRLADWSPSFAANVDLWQSLPHLVIGMVVYWAELLTRKTDASGTKMFPSMPREIVSEWAKVFQTLGASNLWRAMRVRGSDTKKTVADLKAAQLELDALKAQLAAEKK